MDAFPQNFKCFPLHRPEFQTSESIPPPSFPQPSPKSKLYDGDLSYHTHFTHISRLAQMASHPHHVLTEAVSIQKGVQDRAQPSPT